jgi:hypothetical protein
MIMPPSPSRPHLTLAAVFLFASFSPGSALDRASEREACAVQDLHVFSIIEAVGATQLVKGEALFKAYGKLMDARRICEEGRFAQAIALYDSIIFPHGD